VLKPFLVSWWDDQDSGFLFYGPMWVDGRRTKGGQPQLNISAAIMAETEEHAKYQVTQAYNLEVELEWWQVKQQPYGWRPLNEKQMRETGAIWSQKPH
jgi:hypothetical protein